MHSAESFKAHLAMWLCVKMVRKMECPYPYLTPHITLAYFSHKGFDENSAQKLKAVVAELSQKSLDITLDTNKLFYQKFVSMNDYVSVFKLS